MFDWQKLIARLLILVGLAMIAYYYGTSGYTFFVQKELRRQWDRKVQAAKVSGSPEQADESLPGTNAGGSSGPAVFGRIRIPRLGLDAIVLEGTDRGTLTKGPGHIKGTAMPGERGNTAVSGHRTTFGAPFARLDKLAPGDRIVLSTLNGDFIYSVAGSAVVRPTDTRVIGQEFKDRLTLTTCDPPGSAIKRLAVWAYLNGDMKHNSQHVGN